MCIVIALKSLKSSFLKYQELQTNEFFFKISTASISSSDLTGIWMKYKTEKARCGDSSLWSSIRNVKTYELSTRADSNSINVELKYIPKHQPKRQDYIATDDEDWELSRDPSRIFRLTDDIKLLFRIIGRHNAHSGLEESVCSVGEVLVLVVFRVTISLSCCRFCLRSISTLLL